MNGRYKSLLVAVAMLFGFSGIANSAIVITAVESGGDVVFSTDGGTMDLTGLTLVTTANNGTQVSPTSGTLVFNSPDNDLDIYSGLTGPTTFGSSSQ